VNVVPLWDGIKELRNPGEKGGPSPGDTTAVVTSRWGNACAVKGL